MPIVATRSNASAFGYGWSAFANVKYAMELVKPTSVDKTGAGSTATISANGSVNFTACETLSLNGVFSAEYDNYVCFVSADSSASIATLYIRYRLSGTDNSTASSYVRQLLSALSTTTSAVRTTTNEQEALRCYSTPAGVVMNFYGPFLAQPTAFRGVTVSDNAGGYIADNAGTHNQSTSYDGFSIYANTGNFTGNIAVYGLRG